MMLDITIIYTRWISCKSKQIQIQLQLQKQPVSHHPKIQVFHDKDFCQIWKWISTPAIVIIWWSTRNLASAGNINLTLTFEIYIAIILKIAIYFCQISLSWKTRLNHRRIWEAHFRKCWSPFPHTEWNTKPIWPLLNILMKTKPDPCQTDYSV